MTVCWRVWYSHCTRARFNPLVSCSDELAVYSCPFFCPQRQVAKLASGLFYYWSLLRNNSIPTNLQRFTSSYRSRRFAACDCWTQTSLAGNAVKQWLQIAVSHVYIVWKKVWVKK